MPVLDSRHEPQLSGKTPAEIVAQAESGQTRPDVFSAANQVAAQKQSGQDGALMELHQKPQRPQTHSSMPGQQRDTGAGSTKGDAPLKKKDAAVAEATTDRSHSMMEDGAEQSSFAEKESSKTMPAAGIILRCLESSRVRSHCL